MRKGWILEDGTITEFGNTLYTTILNIEGSPKEVMKKLKDERKEGFELWWSIFPPTDGYEYKGKKFKSTRTLRENKQKCMDTQPNKSLRLQKQMYS